MKIILKIKDYFKKRKQRYLGVISKEIFEKLYNNPFCVKDGQITTVKMDVDGIKTGADISSKIVARKVKFGKVECVKDGQTITVKMDIDGIKTDADISSKIVARKVKFGKGEDEDYKK